MAIYTIDAKRGIIIGLMLICWLGYVSNEAQVLLLSWYALAIIACCFVVDAFFQRGQRRKKQDNAVLHALNPATNIFVFDLHHVIVKPDYSKIIKKSQEIPQPWKLFLISLNPYFIYDVIQLIRKSRVPEEYIMVLSEKYASLRPYVGIGMELLNTQKLIPSTYDIIQKLKKAGFKLYIFSNIGQKTYKELLKKLPELSTLFDDVQVASAEQQWLHKPHIESYNMMLQKFNAHGHQVIFIDNKLSNLTQAETFGIKVLLYQSEKQLRNAFAALLSS